MSNITQGLCEDNQCSIIETFRSQVNDYWTVLNMFIIIIIIIIVYVTANGLSSGGSGYNTCT